MNEIFTRCTHNVHNGVHVQNSFHVKYLPHYRYHQHRDLQKLGNIAIGCSCSTVASQAGDKATLSRDLGFFSEAGNPQAALTPARYLPC